MLAFTRKSLLIRGSSPKVNPLPAGRIKDKGERAVLIQYNSQLVFVRYLVQNSAPLMTSGLSWSSQLSEQNLKHRLNCGTYYFTVPSNQEFIITSIFPLDKLNCLPKLSPLPDILSVLDS